MKKKEADGMSFKSNDVKGNEDEEIWVFNGGSNQLSNSRLSSLLASKDRDFLLSPTGNQEKVWRKTTASAVDWMPHSRVQAPRMSRVKISQLEDKVVGLYFSANWYRPCRSFTPVLASVYEQLKGQGVGFEIIFVSSDEDIDAFSSYRACMPWLAIPFSDLETKKALNRKFDVEGIPSLIILQPNGNQDVATLHDGVEIIYRFGAQSFPFTKQRLEELEKEVKEKHESQTITNLLTSHTRDFLLGHPSPKQVPIASLVGKTIGLYFSAQWCLPGLKFTPKLISIYQKIKQMLVEEREKDEDFEIVLVSSDRDQNSFDLYFETMPWLALPFGDSTIKNLTKYFDVQGIPSLVILGPDGKTLTKHGRNLINLYQDKAYPFTEAQLELLEKQMDEEAKSLPESELHEGHHHELTLVSQSTGGGPFICCDCDEQGSGWAYQCIECGYEVHPKCVRAANRGPAG